jgi:hypothetical protein
LVYLSKIPFTKIWLFSVAKTLEISINSLMITLAGVSGKKSSSEIAAIRII